MKIILRFNKRARFTFALTFVVAASAVGCGHYPLPIHSTRSIYWGSASEYMIVIVSLPLKDWPRLQKFSGLEHLYVAEEMQPKITNDHLKVLSKLNLLKLCDVVFNDCTNITDD